MKAFGEETEEDEAGQRLCHVQCDFSTDDC